jgi:ribosomal-protein-alanine N-acetyltransferase
MRLPIDAAGCDWSIVVPEAYPPGPVVAGYPLIPDAWDQGFATEVCARLLRFVF